MKLTGKYINYDEIIKSCQEYGIEVTWRKLNYYKLLGLLPLSVRERGDKRGYYPDGVVNQLIIYHFLQRELGLTLQDIKKMIEKLGVGADIFAKWIDKTYSRFWVQIFLYNAAREVKEMLCVTSIKILNKIYKEHLQQNGAYYFQTTLPGRGKRQHDSAISDDIIAKAAYTWAHANIRAVKEIYRRAQ